LIGAATNNGIGMAGVAPGAKLLPVRVLGKCGGFDSDIIAAMLWAAGIHVAGVPDNPFPARIENLSLGATGSCVASYTDVISQLAARGVLVVASAGNEGGPVDVPGNCPGVAAVAGLRHVGTKVGYSSLGPEIAVSAPAGNCVNVGGGPCLFSIDTTTNLGTTTPGTNAYTDQINSNVGTSFSAPIVSGIVGLMLSANGNLSAAQLLSRLREGATKPFPVSSDPAVPQCHVPASAADVQGAECSCTTSTCGAGMANALGSVRAAQRPIAAIAVPASVAAGQNVVLQGGGSAAACHLAIGSYSWSVASGSATIQGAQTSTATVVAPSSGSFTLRLTVTDDGGRQDSADVVVTSSSAATAAPAAAGSTACLTAISASIPAVTISPTTASVVAGSGTQAFAASVANTANTAVSWQVNGVTGGNATVGTISSAGLYAAPAAVPSPATVSVTAVSAADSLRSASAQLTVTAAAPAPTPPTATPSSGGGGGGGALDRLSLLLLALLAGLQAAQRAPRRGRQNAGIAVVRVVGAGDQLHV
jgi:serine protease